MTTEFNLFDHRVTIVSGSERMPVDPVTGYISRTRPGNEVAGSAQWRIRGAVERNNFGNVTRRYSASDVLLGRVGAWHWKNGRQRTFLLDFDHGSIREWRNPTHCVLAVNCPSEPYAEAAS